MGAGKFETTVGIQARRFNIPITMDMAMATNTVTLYRSEFPEIPATWRYLDKVVLPALAHGHSIKDFGPCQIRYNRIILPNGTALVYNNLRQIEDDDGGLQWAYTYAGKTKYIWGGTLLENIVQALDRVHVFEAMLRVRKRTPFSLAHQVHDELIYVVPDALVSVVEKIVVQEMARRPVWGPDLPLAAEAHHGASYGECK